MLKWNKSDRERQILSDSYVQSKMKPEHMATDTKNRSVVARGGGWMGEIGEGGWRHKLRKSDKLSPGDVMYSVVTGVKYTVLYIWKRLRW